MSSSLKHIDSLPTNWIFYKDTNMDRYSKEYWEKIAREAIQRIMDQHSEIEELKEKVAQLDARVLYWKEYSKQKGFGRRANDKEL